MNYIFKANFKDPRSLTIWQLRIGEAGLPFPWLQIDHDNYKVLTAAVAKMAKIIMGYAYGMQTWSGAQY